MRFLVAHLVTIQINVQDALGVNYTNIYLVWNALTIFESRCFMKSYLLDANSLTINELIIDYSHSLIYSHMISGIIADKLP